MLVNSLQIYPAEIRDYFDSSEDREVVSKILIDEDDTTSPLQMVKDCLNTLSKVSTKEQIKQARLKIREMEAAGQDATDLMLQVVQMQKDLHA